ncbi:helix-turn-helix domain-containing protein [Streptomyces sp. NPDC015350]|uniref:helix-turn-helix domain-containing protein n=1 Tax=Streptomyces sp. NPDC015350 TaxID=3364955 RepID=UPI0036FBBB6C
MSQSRTRSIQPAEAAELAARMRAGRLEWLVKGRRTQLGLRQEDVAARLDLTPRAYGSWERGQVKQWTDEKLRAWGQALEMTDLQVEKLFWIAANRAPQAEAQHLSRSLLPSDSPTACLLTDYGRMMESLSLPTFLADHRWDVKMTNRAYRDAFGAVRAHPAAMPDENFLRFGLFHPDAPTVMDDHDCWQLSMLAQLASSLEKHDQDPVLHSLRRDIHRHPRLRAVYLNDMPDWILGNGTSLEHHEGPLRNISGPDTTRAQMYRLVAETPRALQAVGLTRITFVPVQNSALTAFRPKSRVVSLHREAA